MSPVIDCEGGTVRGVGFKESGKILVVAPRTRPAARWFPRVVYSIVELEVRQGRFRRIVSTARAVVIPTPVGR